MAVLRYWYALAVWMSVVVHELGHATMYWLVAGSLPKGRGWMTIGIGLSCQEAEERLAPGRWIRGSRRGVGFCYFSNFHLLSPRRQWWVLLAGPLAQGIVALLTFLGSLVMLLSVIPQELFGRGYEQLDKGIMIGIFLASCVLVAPWIAAQLAHLADNLESTSDGSDIVRMRTLSSQMASAKKANLSSEKKFVPAL